MSLTYTVVAPLMSAVLLISVGAESVEGGHPASDPLRP